MSAARAAEELGLRRILRMALLVLLGLLAITLEAAPLGLGTAALPSPDLLYCLVAHWALRAPGAAPVLLVFSLGLARDLLTDLPVGLGALLLVFAAEALKAQRGTLARQPLVMEWLAVALGAAAMALALWLAVALTLAAPPSLALLAQQAGLTVAVYPLLTLALAWPLGLRQAREPARSGGDRA